MKKLLLSSENSYNFFARFWQLTLLVFLFIGGKSYGQMFQFNFESGITPSIDNVVGTPALSVIGVLANQSTNACSGANGFQWAGWDTGDAYRFTVNTTGYSNMTFSYNERTQNSNVSTFIVRVSSDLTTWTTIRSAYTPPEQTCASSGLLTVPAAFNNLPNVYIEIYKTVNAGGTGNNFRIDDVELTGTLTSTYNVPSTGNNTINTCSGLLYDSGGTGNYVNSSNGYTVITPSTPGSMARVSGSITSEAGWDYLTVYDGSGTTGTVLWGGSAHGSGTSCTTFTVPVITSTTGSLTVKFNSDGSGECAGFALNISCVTEPNIVVSSTSLSGLNYVVSAGPSASQTYNLSAFNLTTPTGNITVTGSTNFLVSKDNSTFTTSVVVPFTGSALSSTPIYTRLKAGLAIGTYSSTITHTGGGATQKDIAVSGAVIAPPPANDLCSSATVLTVNAAAIAGVMTNASATPAIDSYIDVWYKFTPSCTSKYTITLSDFTGDLDLYYFASCAATTPVQSSTSISNPEILTTSVSLTASTTYFIRVRAFNLAGQTSNFNIAVNNQINIATQPANASVGVGSTANFASSIPGTATGYQWEVNSGSGWSSVTTGTGGTTNSYTTAATTSAMNGYQYRVVISNGTCASVISNPAILTVGTCASVPTSNDANGITNVIVGSANFGVADVTFYNYTTTIPDLAQGENIVSSVSFATGYTYVTHIWIDFNDDNVFDNINEKVFTGTSASTNPTTLNTTFLLNIAANLGQHKMRIGTADTGQATPNPCYSGSFGVTIDLMVNIIAGCTPAPNPVGVISGTTPNCNSTVLTYTGADASTGYWQTTADGENLLFPATATRNVTLTGTYYVRIYDGDCWSASTASRAVVINKSPAITTQPSGTNVVTGATATFTVVATGTSLSYQWETNASGSWANVSGVGTNASYTTSATTLAMNDTNYRVTVSSALCGTSISNIATLNVSACVPSSTSALDYISSFATTGGVTNINRTSTSMSSGGYGNLYNTISATQEAGATLSFTETYQGGNHGFNIWVDYNNDGDFDDTDEKVYSSVVTNGTGFSGSFVIPSATAAGNYRMRIRAQFNQANPANCSVITYGEALDFKLVVTASCTAPVVPENPISNSPQCLPTGVTVSKVGTAPVGQVWYWQTTATGTDIGSVNSAATYTVTTPGTSTIYLRSRIESTECWSPAASIVVIVNNVTAITTPPSSIAIYTGSTATFTVSASGTGLSYQWEVNTGSIWANIGTNSPSLTTATGTLAMNGYLYRVTVSGLCGTPILSSVATLTVTSPPCFEESYVSLTGSGTAWSGNSNFSVSGGVRERNGAIQISTNSTNGVITSTPASVINGLSGDITIKMKVKGWSTATVPIKISFGALSTTINFVGAGDYGSTSYSTIVHTFTGITAGSQLNIESVGTTNATRRFLIGEIELYCGIVPDNTCIPSNAISNTVFINKVNFLGTQNDIENTSTNIAGGFQDFTSLVSNPIQIQGEGINIRVNVAGSAFIKAWIDLNNDGDFVDNQEVIFITDIGQSATTFGYQIPLSLAAGDYRIRIRVEDYDDGYGNDAFGSCDDLATAGETEDYKITIVQRCAAQVATTTGQERCGVGSVALGASTLSSGVTEFRWYTTAVGGTYTSSTVASNATVFNTPSISTTTTYYVAAWDGDCETQVRKEVKAVVKEIPEITFTPAAPVSCDAFQPIELKAEDSLETVFLLNENFETASFATASFENYLVTDNGSTINDLSNWDQQVSTFIPTLSKLSWLPAISSGFGTNKFAFTTSDVGQTPSNDYYTVDNALQMKNTINSIGFTNLTLSFRLYFSRYYSPGTAPEDENVSVEVSIDGGTTFTPLLTPVKYVTSQGNPGNFALKVIDVSNYINQPDLKFRIRYHTTTWADGVAVDDVQVFGSKVLTASYSWIGSDVSVFTDAALLNEYVPGSAIDKVYIVPGETLLELSSFNINITTTLTNGCDLIQPLAVLNNAKIWAGTDTNWNTASNWKPSGVPTAVNCIIIPEVGILPLIPSAANVIGKTITVNNNAILNVPEGSTLTISDEVHVKTGGELNVLNGGSLVQITDVNNASGNTNTGNINMQRITQPMNKFDYTYWGSPVSGTTLNALSPDTHVNRYYSYNPDAEAPTPNWTAITGGAATMIAGKGYIIRAPNDYSTTTYTAYTGTFTGVPNNGTVNIVVSGSSTVEKYNLLGNPYPSAINASDFVTANATGLNPSIQGTLYFWTHNTPFSSSSNYSYSSGDYASWNGTGETATNSDEVGDNTTAPDGYIAAGQGFFVQGSDTGGTVVFKNTMRETGNNMTFFKSNPAQTAYNANATATQTTEKSRVWLNLQGGTNGFSQTLVGYITNATNDYDTLFDGKSFGGNSVTFYSINNTSNLVIQGRALPFVDTDEVPLGYKTTITGNLTISIDHKDGALENQAIYLKDYVLDVVHNLSVSDYIFESLPGTFDSRFVLRYLPAVDLANPTFDEQISNVTIRKNDATLRVNSPYETIDEILVYDIMGRLVFEKKDVNSNRFEVSQITNSDQTLIIKVKLGNGGVVTKKVM